MTSPMLANTARKKELDRYIQSPDWVAEQKLDGQRQLTSISEGKASPIGRSGAPKVTNVSPAILAEFERGFPTGEWTFDGELVGGRLQVFDLVQAGTLITPKLPFHQRREALEIVFRDWQPNPAVLQLVPCARTAEAKAELVATARAEQAEGVMFKAVNGAYYPGRRSERWLKYKFVSDMDVIITALGHEGKENAVLSLLDPDNNRVVEIGRASTIGKRPAPQVGDVWEVRYLNIGEEEGAPRLYQPRLLRKRDDKALSECTVDQIAGQRANKSYIYRTRSER